MVLKSVDNPKATESRVGARSRNEGTGNKIVTLMYRDTPCSETYCKCMCAGFPLCKVRSQHLVVTD